MTGATHFTERARNSEQGFSFRCLGICAVQAPVCCSCKRPVFSGKIAHSQGQNPSARAGNSTPATAAAEYALDSVTGP